MTCRSSAVLLVFAVLIPNFSAAQAKPATQTTTPPPAAPAKWIPPVKGLATIEVIRGKPRRIGNEVVNVLKIKNTSKGAIGLLTVEEFWYDQKRAIVSGDTQRVKRLINPGEIVEVTTKSPYKEGLYTNLYTFVHANGKIDAKAVTKFSDQ